MKFNLLVTLILFCAVFEVNSQKPNHSGFTYFSEYNSKLITPETSQKHVISFGTGINQFTSRLTAPTTTIYNGEINSTVPLWRVGLGYHYLFFKNKNLPLFKKKKRYEFSGFSIYTNVYGNYLEAGTYTNTTKAADSIPLLKSKTNIPQVELRFTYTNPFMSYRGKVFNFYFLHEYGLSVMTGTSNTITRPDEQKTAAFINVVPMSLKFGKRPIFFKASANVSFDSKLLQLEKVKGSFGLEMQIYFYKIKK